MVAQASRGGIWLPPVDIWRARRRCCCWSFLQSACARGTPRCRLHLWGACGPGCAATQEKTQSPLGRAVLAEIWRPEPWRVEPEAHVIWPEKSLPVDIRGLRVELGAWHSVPRAHALESSFHSKSESSTFQAGDPNEHPMNNEHLEVFRLPKA